MLNPVFLKKNFILCQVPVPHGYPQSQTHAGIAVYKNKFYLTTSPYPLKKYNKFQLYFHIFLQKITGGKLGKFLEADSFENPLLYEGDSINHSLPISFRLLEPAPLVKKPKSELGVISYNSDPDIFISNDDIYLLNRRYTKSISSSGYVKRMTKISLIEGKLSERIELNKPIPFVESSKLMLSPCLSKICDKYIFTFIESNSAIDGLSFEGIFMSVSDSIHGLADSKIVKVDLNRTNLLPWHMSLFVYHDELYSVVACVERGNRNHIWQMLGKFDKSLHSLKIYSRPLTDYNSYRGSAYVLEDGTFVLYSTTLHEHIKGSNSCDGRDVIMASMQFEKLLKELEYEN